MNPELKFHSLIVSGSTLVVFTAWSQLATLVANYPAISVITASLVSIGIYRLLTIVLLAAFRKSSWVKKFILGPSYMEGTWIGFFIGHDEKTRFFIEAFEQDLSGLVIRGKGFRENGEYHGSWISDNTEINARQGKLTYTYEADVIGNSHINPGLAAFSFERKSKDLPPHSMIGFSSDIFNPKKLKSFEKKISSDTSVKIDDALVQAREFYETNKNNF